MVSHELYSILGLLEFHYLPNDEPEGHALKFLHVLEAQLSFDILVVYNPLP